MLSLQTVVVWSISHSPGYFNLFASLTFFIIFAIAVYLSIRHTINAANSQHKNFLVRDINMSGGARENFITAYFLGGDMRSGSQILDMSLKELDDFLRTNNIQLGRGIGMLRNEFVQPEAALVSLGSTSNEAVYYLLGRADDFTLPDLAADELEPSPGMAAETPELVKARELWQAGHTSDRKLRLAMKDAGFEITLYRANQLANQLKVSD
jgi:hypothetical protein